MKMIHSKLLCLNLSLLLLFTLPVQAISQPVLGGSGVQPYYLIIDNLSIRFNEVRSGNGWEYEDGALRLNNYSGSGIRASGDLTVYSTGDVTIQGEDGAYASDGIIVSGVLQVFVNSGTLTISGGSGTVMGGDAIDADVIFAYLYGGTAAFTGGGASGDAICGHGINARSSAAIYGPANQGSRLAATGGTAAPGSNVTAGCAIHGGDIGIHTDAVLRGGSAGSAAPAVYTDGVFEVGCVNAELYGGQSASGVRAEPVLFDKTEVDNWYYDEHTTLLEQEGHFSIKIDQYRLRLIGGGGVYAGATYTDLINYYPARYQLSDYVFTRDGYAQTAWATASGGTVPLDASFRPEKNTTLDAVWVELAPGDILLNGLSGTLADGKLWQRYHNAESVTLPSSLFFGGEDTDLVGWHTGLTPQADDNDVLSGGWYAGSVSAAAEPISLYALDDSVGSYVVYHAEGGTPIAGGNMTVQHRYLASCTDLDVYLVNGSDYITAPYGCAFSGWATQKGGDVRYAPGTVVSVTQGAPLHLYAVWTPFERQYSVPGCDAWVDPNTNGITVKVTEEWYNSLNQPSVLAAALYDSGGKLLGCTLHTGGTYQKDGAFSLQYAEGDLPRVSVLALNAGGGPAGVGIQMDLSKLSFASGDSSSN